MGSLRDALDAFVTTLTAPSQDTATASRPPHHDWDDTAHRAPLLPLMEVPRAQGPIAYLGSETFPDIPGYVFLSWNTSVGELTAAYATNGKTHMSRASQVRHHKPDIRVLIEPLADTAFLDPEGPDVRDHAGQAPERRVPWKHYAHAIGQPAPYWPPHLKHERLIRQWRPGDSTVYTTPTTEPDPSSLLELAALYPPGSTTVAVLRHYYLSVMRSVTGDSDICVETLNEARHLADSLTLAASAIPIPDPGMDTELYSDDTLRAVFSDIVHRQDTLGEHAVLALTSIGMTEYFPFTKPARHRLGKYLTETNPEASPQFNEWRARLEPVPTRTADARFAQLDQEERHVRFLDPATGAPVLKDDLSDVRTDVGEHAQYWTMRPRRLPTTSPLAEVILDGEDQDMAWVRTEDGTLYPLPCGRRDYNWGYHGSGPANLTVIVERLLDDISAATPDTLQQPESNALEKLFQHSPTEGKTLSRATLEQARERDKNQ